jgi:hypothetical protein
MVILARSRAWRAWRRSVRALAITLSVAVVDASTVRVSHSVKRVPFTTTSRPPPRRYVWNTSSGSSAETT